MFEISRDDARRLAEEEAPLVLARWEVHATRSAVVLEQFSTCYVLGLRSDPLERCTLYVFPGEIAAWEAYDRHKERLQLHGTPFFG